MRCYILFLRNSNCKMIPFIVGTFFVDINHCKCVVTANWNSSLQSKQKGILLDRRMKAVHTRALFS